VFDAVRSDGGYALIDWQVTSDNNNDAYDWKPDLGIEDKRFTPFAVEVRDPVSSASTTVTVIGVLPVKLDWKTVAGIYVNEAAYTSVFGAPDYQRTYLALEDGANARSVARGIEATLAADGVQTDSIQKLIDDVAAQDAVFTRVFQLFMMLGLFVGIAALGVIAFRSVVERRQQIGVLRAIGFRRRMVQATFLLESSFVALTSIVVGTGLGLLLAWNIIRDMQRQPSWENLTLVVPWVNLGVIFLVVYAVALAATLAPALRASRIRPAEALRYQ
jgi:putative ABC transport system permease protein